MDKTQLVTIIVTAIVSVTAKELFTWIFSTIKGLSILATAKEKLKTLFSKRNRVVMGDLAALIFYLLFLVNFSLKDGAPSRSEILLVIGAIFAAIFMTFTLLVRLVKIKLEKDRGQRQ